MILETVSNKVKKVQEKLVNDSSNVPEERNYTIN